jgi:hypothetical protein
MDVGIGLRGVRIAVLVLVPAILAAVPACSDGGGVADPVSRGRIIFALDDRNTILAFGSETPGVVTQRRGIRDLPAGERIVGIDVRPADGRLYALGATSRVYVVDSLGFATVVGSAPFRPGLVGTAFGWAVDPVADQLRALGDSDQDLRIDPAAGTAEAAPLLAFATGDEHERADPNVVAAAYTNAIAPAPGSTTLYGIESGFDVLVTIAPETGLLTTVGPLDADTGPAAGFDIAGDDGAAYAALRQAGNSLFYRIDLATGEADFVGGIDHVNPIVGIAVAP